MDAYIIYACIVNKMKPIIDKKIDDHFGGRGLATWTADRTSILLMYKELLQMNKKV